MRGWRNPQVIGAAIFVQLLNVVLWLFLSPHGLPLFCPQQQCLPCPLPPMPVDCVCSRMAACQCATPPTSNLQFAKEFENVTSAVRFLKRKYPDIVSSIELAQAPFGYTDMWGEMAKMVKLRHGLKQDLFTSRYETTLRRSIAEREDILETFYNARAEVGPMVRDMASKVKVDNTVVLMAFNYGSIVLFYNWLCSCRRANIVPSNLMVISADEKTHLLLSSMNITSLYLPKLFGTYQSQGVRAFGTTEWNPFGRLKVLVPKLILEAGIDVFFQDVDVVWFKDPLQTVKTGEFASSDFVIQHVGRNRAMFGPFYGNSGLFFMKGNAYVQACWDRLFFDLDKIAAWSGSQQMVLNYHLGLCAAPNSPMALRVKYVDPNIFVSGWIAQNRTMKQAFIEHNDLYQQFVLYHTNWAVNTAEKIKANQNYKIWFLSSEVTDQTDPKSLGTDFCVA